MDEDGVVEKEAQHHPINQSITLTSEKKQTRVSYPSFFRSSLSRLSSYEIERGPPLVLRDASSHLSQHAHHKEHHVFPFFGSFEWINLSLSIHLVSYSCF